MPRFKFEFVQIQAIFHISIGQFFFILMVSYFLIFHISYVFLFGSSLRSYSNFLLSHVPQDEQILYP